MVLLILFLLLGAAVLYGVFFLFFKLIWVLFKKQRNFWPLVLAGAATLLLLIALGCLGYAAFNRFVRPFNPIIEAASARTQPVYGSHTYKDARYGFEMTLYNGTVMSDWIDLDDVSLLAGVDTNAMLPSARNDENKPFAAYLVARAPQTPTGTAEEIIARIAQYIEQAQFDGEIVLEELFPVQAGPLTDGSALSGTLYHSSLPKGIPFTLLLVPQQNQTYFVAGIGNTPGREAHKTVTSFRIGSR